MKFTDVKIRVPETMAAYLSARNERAELERNALILYPYIRDGIISHGKAAEILGIAKYDLIEMYDRMGIAYLSMDISEAEEEVTEWEKLRGKTA